jgi:hypothetical protein
MLIYSSVTVFLAIIFVFVTAKITNELLQLLSALFSLLWFCISSKLSIVPIEVLIAVSFIFTTQKMHYLNRSK